MTKHTPTPWNTSYLKLPSGADQYNGWHIKAEDLNKTPVALVLETIGGKKNKLNQSPRQKANALHIVKCVNSHEELISLLYEVKNYFRMTEKEDMPLFMEDINKALTNATHAEGK